MIVLAGLVVRDGETEKMLIRGGRGQIVAALGAVARKAPTSAFARWLPSSAAAAIAPASSASFKALLRELLAEGREASCTRMVTTGFVLRSSHVRDGLGFRAKPEAARSPWPVRCLRTQTPGGAAILATEPRRMSSAGRDEPQILARTNLRPGSKITKKNRPGEGPACLARYLNRPMLKRSSDGR